jgi:hypothetical protein
LPASINRRYNFNPENKEAANKIENLFDHENLAIQNQPMYDLTIIPGRHGDLTHSKDEYGEYGSVFASDEDRNIPPPLDFNPNPALDQTANLSANLTSRVTHRVTPKP